MHERAGVAVVEFVMVVEALVTQRTARASSGLERLTPRERDVLEQMAQGRNNAGIAQALLSDPQLVVLDEPTSGLDPAGRKEVRDTILALKAAGKTVFLSSHILSEVEQICDRVAILHQGRLKVEGRVQELTRQYQCNLEQIFLKIIGYQPL